MPMTRRPFVPGLWHGRPMEPEQSDATDEYSDDSYDSEFEEEFGELYEPLDRVFKVGEKVWIHCDRIWYNGVIRHLKTPDQTKNGRVRYFVYFRRKNSSVNMRSGFHPMEGALKPDTIRIRRLLSQSGARIGSEWDAL
ncbi:hypothetical protein BDY19DRAFT_992870 [Irpex rosettiformis]|uniref:Uncharacterized protein n=1 Tax=Irpex rosettiformis TaxID=378272 RepID=A0ACB8U6J2_9APHY|nr:hypothetical protein BDY19DRAFT_992870 [Irpex rosettiformis]